MEVPQPEASIPFPEDLSIQEEAGDSQAWEEPLTGDRDKGPRDPQRSGEGVKEKMQQGAQSRPPLGRTDNSRLLSKMVCSCRGGEASCALSCLLLIFLTICIGVRFSQASVVA